MIPATPTSHPLSNWRALACEHTGPGGSRLQQLGQQGREVSRLCGASVALKVAGKDEFFRAPVFRPPSLGLIRACEWPVTELPLPVSAPRSDQLWPGLSASCGHWMRWMPAGQPISSSVRAVLTRLGTRFIGAIYGDGAWPLAVSEKPKVRQRQLDVCLHKGFICTVTTPLV